MCGYFVNSYSFLRYHRTKKTPSRKVNVPNFSYLIKCTVILKGKLYVQSITCYEGTKGECMYKLYSYFNLSPGWGWVFKGTPLLLYRRYPLSILLGVVWVPELVLMAAKIITLTEFDPRTVQPVVSSYTD